jgi:probable F420-dependent oxidoreductase
MKFGIALPNYGPEAKPENLISIAKLAEHLGYESIWATDHVLPSSLFESPYNHIYEPLTVLSFLAAITENVMLGTSVLVLPLRNPAVVAKTVASLDSLSRGRVILGIGVGGGEDDRLEFQHVGTNFSDRGKRTNEYIKAIRELWCSTEPRFAGKYVNFVDAAASPKPLQPGGPPIWIGGKSDAALSRAAALGDGWHPNYIGAEELKCGLSKLKSMKIKSTRFTVSVRERVRILKPGEEPLQGSRSSIIGTHGAVLESLQRLSATGVDHFVSVPMATDEKDFVEQVNRFAEVVADVERK